MTRWRDCRPLPAGERVDLGDLSWLPDHSLVEVALRLLEASHEAECPTASRLLWRAHWQIAELAVGREERHVIALAEQLARQAAGDE